MINRRKMLQRSAALGLAAAGGFALPRKSFAAVDDARPANSSRQSAAIANPLIPPAQGSIPVAFLISDGAVVIDFAGPWEVFQDVSLPSRADAPFNLYTVGENEKPIQASSGLKIVPDYTIANAPAPKVIVIPAQSPASEQTKEWIRHATKTTDVTMSVCSGAFILASTGLLSGKSATTYHGSYVRLAMQYPDVDVKRGVRFVENGNLASSGGLSCGIDLALRVVERYFGSDVAKKTAFTMEYQGEGWMHPDSNTAYAQSFMQSVEHPVCPVCGMDPSMSLKSEYQGKTYYFCTAPHKQNFDAAPERYITG